MTERISQGPSHDLWSMWGSPWLCPISSPLYQPFPGPEFCYIPPGALLRVTSGTAPSGGQGGAALPHTLSRSLLLHAQLPRSSSQTSGRSGFVYLFPLRRAHPGSRPVPPRWALSPRFPARCKAHGLRSADSSGAPTTPGLHSADRTRDVPTVTAAVPEAGTAIPSSCQLDGVSSSDHWIQRCS